MSKAKDIFDRRLVRARKARGQKLAIDPFLELRAADDIAERLLDVNRQFSSALIMGSPAISKRIIQIAGDKLGSVVQADFSSCPQGLDVICSETSLPFKPQSFDLVISALGLHKINHVPQALMGMKSLLKPDGLFIAGLFGGDTLRELRYALYAAEEMVYGQVSPRISPMITLQQAANLLQKSGFSMPVVDRDYVKVTYKTLPSLYQDLRKMGETNALIGRSRTAVSKRFFTKLEGLYKQNHLDKNTGNLKAGFDILWLTGWATHPDQPKPLKPGSAKSSLADALGVKEQKI